MFALGIQKKALQCLTSRSMLWTGNSALPSVRRVYLHRFMLSWWQRSSICTGKTQRTLAFRKAYPDLPLTLKAGSGREQLWLLLLLLGNSPHWLDSALTLKTCWSKRWKGSSSIVILAAVPSGSSLHSLLQKISRVCRWKSQGSSCYDKFGSHTGFAAEDLTCPQEGVAHNSFWGESPYVCAIDERMLQSRCTKQIHPSPHCCFPEELPSFLKPENFFTLISYLEQNGCTNGFSKKAKQETEGFKLRCELW